MAKYNPDNERIKRRYFDYQKEAMRKSEATILALGNAILRYEEYTNFRGFAHFNKSSAMAFKKYLAGLLAQRDKQPLSKSTVQHTLGALKEFFIWLSREPGYRSKINISDTEYLNYGDKEARAARARPVKPFPTLEQVRRAILAMPSNTVIERRDRALFALAILTAMRDSALISLRLKHIDADREFVDQNPNQVKTKASKQIFTYWTPLGDDLKAIVKEWVTYLRTELLYGNDDPVFPRTKVGVTESSGFTPMGVEPVCWATAATVRKVMREAYARVGLPYFHPHLLRKTLVQVGEQRCRTPEEFKAWSQNIGHESVMTTFRSYGNVSIERQGELIKGMDGKNPAITPETIKEVLNYLGMAQPETVHTDKHKASA